MERRRHPFGPAEEYLSRHGGDSQAAALAFGTDLMRGDPATLKAGYTAENAAIAAGEMFGIDSDDLLPGLRVKPVVVVVRHPDASNDISVHGFQARVIDIDLGSSFDGEPDDDEQAREWADAVLDSIHDLALGHPARLEVEDVVAQTCARLPDGELADIIRRHGGAA